MGRLFGAEIVVLHVVSLPPILPGEGYLPPQMYQEVFDSVRREARAALDRLLASIPGSGLTVRIRLEEGPPAERILEIAVGESADIVVVGTHGRKGFERLVLGSVADRTVRQAACPVLTVPPATTGGSRGDLRRICFPTDFSPTARAAWAWAVAIATAAGAEVDLVHVTFEPVADHHLSAEAIGRMAQALRDQGQAEVERFLEKAALPRERVHVHLAGGVPGEQIVRRARERAADLIVMGTHGWSGAVRWMLGSVAHTVIQTAPCPVLTVAPVGTGPSQRHRF
jgi:nucleotide-binding universal stress UspA family protein